MNEGERLSRRSLLLGGFLRREPSETEHEPEAAGAARPAPTPVAIHRPPGAVPEPRFLDECTRCGDCMTACPVKAIVHAGDRFGAAAGTPMIDPALSPCVMCADLPCIAACEPGVLSPDEPVAMGTAEIRASYCLACNGSLCTVCSEHCPVEGAIRLDERGRPRVAESTCTGCGVCQHVCPAPYNAVVILPRDRGGGEAAAAEPADDWRKRYMGDRSLRGPWDEGVV